MSPLLFASASTTSFPLCSVRLLISMPCAEKKPFLMPRSIGSAFAIGRVATVTVASGRLPAVSRALAVAPPKAVVAITAASAVTKTAARRRPRPLASPFIFPVLSVGCSDVASLRAFAMRTTIRSPHATFQSRRFAVKLGGAVRRGSDCTQLRLDGFRGPEQPGKHLLSQLLHAHPACVNRDVHCGRHGAARVADGDGRRAYALL